MTELFLGFLNRGVAAGWLVLAVVLVRALLRRAPKWADVLLWGMVALRLVLPFSVESALSLLPSAETVRPEVVQYDPAPAITSGVRVIDDAVNPVLRESFAAAPAASVNPLFVWTEIAGAVWLLGAAVLLGYALVSYLSLRRRVQTAVRLEGNVYQSEHIASPFILGVLRPTIYLPCALPDADRASVLAHERAHLARRDHWWKPLGFLLLALYWFHPALWLAYALFCRDVELACDERVVRPLDPAQRADYSQALLACSAPRRMVAACPLAFGEVGVKERVKSVLHYKKPAFWVVVLSAVVCAAVAVCFLTNPQRETMKWAKSLRVEDVARIELTVMPQAIDKQYKDLDADEIAEAVALINECRGRHVRDAEPLAGSTLALYVTTTDGVRHTVVNNGGVYLVIDGDSYRANHAWLNAWPFPEGDAPLPERFDLDINGTVFSYGGESWDLAEQSPVTSLLGCATAGRYVVVTGHGGPVNAVYFIFDTESRTFSRPLIGTHLIWRNDDLSTAVYADGGSILSIDGRTLAELGLAEGEYVYDLAYSQDGTALAVTIVSSEGAARTVRIALSGQDGTPEEVSAPSLTGYAAYDGLLAEIGELRRSGARDIETDFSSDLLAANDYYQSPGWLLCDLDSDGTDELLLGADWGDGHTVLFNVYRLDGAKAVRAVDGWSRSRWYLCADGSLAYGGSSGASESRFSYYRYENGALRHLETLLFLDDGSGGSPWLYSDTTDHYLGGEGFRAVSEEAADAVMSRYVYETLAFTPFP